MLLTDDILSFLQKAENLGSIPSQLPVLPLKDTVIYPYMIFPVLIGRVSALKAITMALEQNRLLLVVAQKDPSTEEPTFSDLYQYGTVVRILQIIRLPNNLLKVLIEGLTTAKIKHGYQESEHLKADISQIKIKYNENDPELQASIKHFSRLFEKYVQLSNNLPPDIISVYENLQDPLRMAYFAGANIQQKVPQKQKILECRTIKSLYLELIKLTKQEIELLKIEEEIDRKVQSSIQNIQKKYYIQEQIRALQNELGEEGEITPDIISLKEAINKAQMPPNVQEKAYEELEKLKKIPTMTPEYSVNRNYLELLVSLPWSQKTQDNTDIKHVQQILDEDHFDLEKPKERILEYIALLNITNNLKRQILCFVGPPGVGKTSLGKSIARALGRKFVRFSLGGIRDEAEIRGHRRTYIGAMPGKIIQAMKKAGTINPVILLDEIDKMSIDFRGDPSAALLEVLDPEQNIAFNDHYLEVDYDLSNVLFITTANVRYDIPLPLQDRMEIIELNSYLDIEKMEIAKRHIIPRLIKEYSLTNFNINFTDKAIKKLITEYTREAGVRNLEREIASILRKLVKEIVLEFNSTSEYHEESVIPTTLLENKLFLKKIARKKFTIGTKEVEKYLKAPRYKDKMEDLEDKVGVAIGLAWTSVGGNTMPVEVTIMPGSEKLTLTGQLGEVMKESAQAGLSFVRSNYSKLGVPKDFFKKKEIHIHIPEGAIAKDGPSAGITMTIALISAASGQAVSGKTAMTGEITLRGNILPVGGLKEKLLAAKRAGIENVIIPKDNERDIEDINPIITEGLNLIFVKNIFEAIDFAFVKDKKKIR